MYIKTNKANIANAVADVFCEMTYYAINAIANPYETSCSGVCRTFEIKRDNGVDGIEKYNLYAQFLFKEAGDNMDGYKITLSYYGQNLMTIQVGHWTTASQIINAFCGFLLEV